MKRCLITGIAGSGKSTICSQLNEMGHEAYDIETVRDMFAMYRKGTDEIFEDYDNADTNKVKNGDWRCNVVELQKLFAGQKQQVAFYCGIATDMGRIIGFFDWVVLLDVSLNIVTKRLRTRAGSSGYGNTEEARRLITGGWRDWFRSEMIRRGAMVISADGAPVEIAEAIVCRCAAERYWAKVPEPVPWVAAGRNELGRRRHIPSASQPPLIGRVSGLIGRVSWQIRRVRF